MTFVPLNSRRESDKEEEDVLVPLDFRNLFGGGRRCVSGEWVTNLHKHETLSLTLPHLLSLYLSLSLSLSLSLFLSLSFSLSLSLVLAPSLSLPTRVDIA